MVSAMKDRNDKKAWAAYDRDSKKLMKKTLKKRSAVEKKYKDAPHPPGLDTDPAEKELGEVTKWYGQELKKLREKHGIK